MRSDDVKIAKYTRHFSFQGICLYGSFIDKALWLVRPTEILEDTFDSLTQKDLSIDGKQREE